MPSPCCALWQAGLPAETAASLRQTLAHVSPDRGLRVFFRADDIGVPSRTFKALIELFARRRVPLALAVVPTWLTPSRWQALTALAAGNPALWCWHQHGWRHANHEKQGRKQEFGPARSKTRLAADLARGRQRLEALMGRAFTPIFTPPWNRCSPDTLALLKSHGYRAVSRSAGSRPQPPDGLSDIAVNVDLHTRKEPDPRRSWQNLMRELSAATAEGLWGVMIHHRRMNPAAFEFLDILLEILTADPRVQLAVMSDFCIRCQ